MCSFSHSRPDQTRQVVECYRRLQDVKTANVLLGRNYVAKISDVRAHAQFQCCLCLVGSNSIREPIGCALLGAVSTAGNDVKKISLCRWAWRRSSAMLMAG